MSAIKSVLADSEIDVIFFFVALFQPIKHH